MLYFKDGRVEGTIIINTNHLTDYAWMLSFLDNNAEKYHMGNSFFVLAGDSGGSMITAATANVITNPNYAKITKVNPGLKPNQLKGLLLYCGIYEIDNLNTEGEFGTFLEKVNWAYFGKKLNLSQTC